MCLFQHPGNDLGKNAMLGPTTTSERSFSNFFYVAQLIKDQVFKG